MMMNRDGYPATVEKRVGEVFYGPHSELESICHIIYPAWENDARSGWFGLVSFGLVWFSLVWPGLVSFREGETDGNRYGERERRWIDIDAFFQDCPPFHFKPSLPRLTDRLTDRPPLPRRFCPSQILFYNHNNKQPTPRFSF